ncbi:hypothetical protein AALO_G00031540 [Alosa alosa]|uniref:Uncharacterized protein n=1 Tax=Alosa alosa TaxID=278164 RepID=A0AAV6HG25_9TELE|nr:hypothetical protein AALO_G00031540 [Alosa alosa]
MHREFQIVLPIRSGSAGWREEFVSMIGVLLEGEHYAAGIQQTTRPGDWRRRGLGYGEDERLETGGKDDY